MSQELIIALLALFSSGGVIYLVVDKLVLSKKDKAEAHTASTEAQRGDISTGLEALGFYKEIDDLIKQHTDPLNAKIDELSAKVSKWCCYRNCEIRLRDESATEKEPSVTLIDLSEFLKVKAMQDETEG